MKMHGFGWSALKGILLLAAALAVPCRSQPSLGGLAAAQSRISFESAVRNGSTSPSYVLISVINGRTGQMRTICTTANSLRGAIHREYGLGYGIADSRKAVELALKSENHVFRFEKQTALDNIPMTYTPEELAAARVLLAPLPPAELKSSFSLRPAGRLSTEGYARDAVACVLIERGLSPMVADRSGQLYVAP